MFMELFIRRHPTTAGVVTPDCQLNTQEYLLLTVHGFIAHTFPSHLLCQSSWLSLSVAIFHCSLPLTSESGTFPYTMDSVDHPGFDHWQVFSSSLSAASS